MRPSATADLRQPLGIEDLVPTRLDQDDPVFPQPRGGSAPGFRDQSERAGDVRAALEQHACECYGVAREEYRRMRDELQQALQPVTPHD